MEFGDEAGFGGRGFEEVVEDCFQADGGRVGAAEDLWWVC